MKKGFDFKVGTDPEFNIVFKDNPLHAEKTIPIIVDNGLQRSDMGYNIPGAGQIGWDGNSAIAEIRPNPSNEPQEVINNIMKLLRAITTKTKLFSLDTKSKYGTIGGHIHIEIDPLKLSSKHIEVIHNKMSTLFLPIILGENNANVKNRLKDGYGQITDYRIQQITKGVTTYELRAPTAEWLTTPKLANATLSYIGVIFHEIKKGSKTLAGLEPIMLKNHEQAKAIQNLTVANFVPLIVSLFRTIKKAVRNFELYPQFKDEIEYIFNPKKILRDKEKVNYDIAAGWGLEKKKMPTKRSLMSDKTIEQISLRINMDELIPIIPIMGSADTNVDMFVHALKQRIIALNWKLKNNYYIFGLRNGINKPIAGNEKGLFWGHDNIVTQTDKKMIEDLFKRISARCQNRETILFGIPYKDRISYKPGLKKFIKNIYLIEKGVQKLTKIKNLPDIEEGKLKEIFQDPQNTEISPLEGRPSTFSSA